jgi:branched-chain amino acid transport system permease protein
LFPDGLHTPIWAGDPLAAGLAAIAGVLLGAPVLKLRGDYLAIVTLGFGEIIRVFMNNLEHPVNITNGPRGLDRIDSMNLFGCSCRQVAADRRLHHLRRSRCTTTCSCPW